MHTDYLSPATGLTYSRFGIAEANVAPRCFTFS